jgi:hypothetical protein
MVSRSGVRFTGSPGFGGCFASATAGGGQRASLAVERLLLVALLAGVDQVHVIVGSSGGRVTVQAAVHATRPGPVAAAVLEEAVAGLSGADTPTVRGDGAALSSRSPSPPD